MPGTAAWVEAQRNTTKAATARNPGAWRSTASATKPTSCARRIVNAWTAGTSSRVTRDERSSPLGLILRWAWALCSGLLVGVGMGHRWRHGSGKLRMWSILSYPLGCRQITRWEGLQKLSCLTQKTSTSESTILKRIDWFDKLIHISQSKYYNSLSLPSPRIRSISFYFAMPCVIAGNVRTGLASRG